MPPTIAERLEEDRKELLDLTLRNPLINFRTLKARGVRVVDELPVEVFRILVAEGRPMSFLAAEEAVSESGSPDETLELEAGPAARHVDRKLQTPYDKPSLEKRLLNTFYTERTSLEEQGVSVLYLALGMLRWFESATSDLERRAPLVLVPVELDRTNVRSAFRLSHTGEEVGDNLSLRAKLNQDFGLRLPELVEGSEGIDLEGYFAQVEESIRGLNRWHVDRDAIELGFFSFGKFLMFNDLDVAQWPEGNSPGEHPVLGRLLGEEGFTRTASPLPDGANIDDHLAPADVHHVVDADSTQIQALVDALDGKNLVIQGPPGTGKSQTITNLVAEALGKGWKVLFVSEKMAALEVVKRRLDALGLGDACLELHSHKANKRDFLAELKRTMNLPGLADADHSALMARLGEARDRLNRYVSALHSPVAESGVTPFELHGHLTRLTHELDAELPTLSIPESVGWTREGFEQRRSVVQRLQAQVAEMGVPRNHPFWGSTLTLVLPTDLPSLERAIAEARDATKALVEAGTELATGLQLPRPLDSVDAQLLCRAARRALEAPGLEGVDLSPSRWESAGKQVEALLGDGRRRSAVRSRFDALFIPEAWSHDVLALRQAYAAHGAMWWRFLIADFRRARAEFAGLCRAVPPKDPKAGLEALDGILEVQRLGRAIEALDSEAKELFGLQWQGTDSDWAVLERIAEWVRAVHAGIEKGEIPRGLLDFMAGGPALEAMEPLVTRVEGAIERHASHAAVVETRLEIDSERRFGNDRPFGLQPFDELGRLYEECAGGLERIHQMTGFNNAAVEAAALGLEPLVELAARWKGAGELLVECFDYNWYRTLSKLAYQERPALGRFDGAGHVETVRQFRDLDEASFKVNRTRLARAHRDGVPSRVSGVGQTGVLLAEFEKKRRHRPIRSLVGSAGNAIQAIKPVFMMSPMSIATYLPPGAVTFDLVVFDEASQVKPVEAFGAIMRGNQTVVVGDSKQLPPTSFFDKVAGGEEDGSEEEETVRSGDMESVLSLFNARAAPERMLRWHYRSRHESLIAVSNAKFYDNGLVTFPSPVQGGAELGVRYHHLPDTTYDRGGSRTNREEAGVVARAVMDHARETPELTLGVAAFSQAQAEALQLEVEQLRRADPSLESFFGSHSAEPFFIKNIENVQGDERDVILISVGYGRDARGQVTMNFGPLNREGGERRLNVLITRARRRCEVFTNLKAEDIRVTPQTPRGVAALREYLRYADTGELEMPTPTGGDPDSPFEAAVARALRAHGHTVDHQVGTAGFRVDLGVLDLERPGRYLLGIECDGASYHSARSARDRDRIRQGVLEGLGWRLHRIWSTDWFRNPDGELRKALEAIGRAKAAGTIQTGFGGVSGGMGVPDSGDSPERAGPTPEPVPDQGFVPDPRPVPEPGPKPELDPVPPKVLTSQRYETVTLKSRSLRGAGIHEETLADLAGLIREVVRGESPVHFEDAGKRVMDAYGVKRMGNRVRDRLSEAVRMGESRGWVRREGEFLSDPDQDQVPVRDRTDFEPNVKKLERVAPVEIDAALLLVTKEALGATADELPSAACALLGFSRVSQEMRDIVDARIAFLLSEGRLVQQGGSLIVAEGVPPGR